MTTSMFFAMLAAVYLAPHIGPKAAALMWAMNTVLSLIYLGKS